MKRFSRWIVILLTAAMVVSLLPAVSAFAAETGTEQTAAAQDAAVPEEVQAEEPIAEEDKTQLAAVAAEPETVPATEPETVVNPEPETIAEPASETAAEAETPEIVLTEEPLSESEPADGEDPSTPSEGEPDPAEEADADYTKVEEAKAKVPADLTLYTEESVKVLEDALAAVEEGKKASEQETVDAWAAAIEAAIEALELKPLDGKIELAITNNTNMFKVVSAYVEETDGKLELVAALSGTTYENLFIGTYEEASANGYNTANWIKGFKDKNKKLAFRIPIERTTTFIPVISISNTYLKSYLSGKNVLERAFYARQFQIDLTKKTLVSGDYEFTQSLTITNNVKGFKVDSAVIDTLGGPNNNSYKADLTVKMGDTTYDAAYIGTKKEAASAKSTFSIGSNRLLTIPIKWLETFGKPETLQTLVGEAFTISFHTAGKGKKAWVEREFTISEKKGTLVISAADESGSSSGGKKKPVIPGQDDEKKKYEDTTGGGTAAVDNTTSLKDGVYTPDKFSFSGGSGRIALSCTKVEVKGGKAYATIVFRNTQSGTSEFSYVKASGGTYYCTQVGATSVAVIPVELNQNNSILGLTTKMSASHEIAYTIFIYIAGADKKEGSDLSKNDKMDEEAPDIAGLDYQDEEKLENAEFFKVFNYSDGIRLLEIDMSITSDKKDKEAEASETKDTEEPAAEEETEVVVNEETGETEEIKTSRADAQAELYKGKVVKYLLVPEDTEIPAGLEKETIVVMIPAKSVYTGSEDIEKIIKDLKAEDKIKSRAEEEKDQEKVPAAGDYKDMDYKTLIKAKTELVILPNEIMKDKEEKEVFNSLAEDLANLDIVAIVDRSAEEKTEKAKAEWLKVYGMLLGCEKEAQAAYDAVK